MTCLVAAARNVFVCMVYMQVTSCGSTYSAVSYSGLDCTGTATTVGPVATNTCNVEANGSSDRTTCSGAAALTASIGILLTLAIGLQATSKIF